MKADGLTFDWPHRHRLHLLLPAMIMAAALGHAVMVVVFSASHPPAAFDGPRPSTVYFLPPAEAESGELASLLAADDPALFAPLRGLPGTELPRASYPATYAAAKPQFAPLPRLVGPTPVAAATPLGPVAMKVVSRPLPTTLRQEPRLRLSPGLAARWIGGGLAPTLDAAPPVRVFLGVLSDGTVGYATLDREPSEPATAEAALALVRSLHFAPAEELEWGFIQIEWGAKGTSR
jgi:hypothetical protein